MTAVVEHLRRDRDGASKVDLVKRIGRTSAPTVQRALDTLMDEYGAPLVYVRGRDVWRLLDPHFALPLEDPEPSDLRAVLLAEAMVAPLADEQLRQRLRRLAEQLDQRLRSRKKGSRAPVTGALSARATTATSIDPRHLEVLHDAVRRHAVRMDYLKPRQNELRRYTVEPWGITALDNAVYFKGWVRERGAPRTFRLAQVEKIVAIPNSRPTVRCPRPDAVWGDDNPAFGIDEDRPDTAVLRIRGPVARWLHRIQWHPQQQDRWLEDQELLERTLPYRSCREMARRVLTILDGITSIHPPALRAEVNDAVHNYLMQDHLPDYSPLPAAGMLRKSPSSLDEASTDVALEE